MSVDFKWKIIISGEPAVGKTSLMLRYTEKKFQELYIPTIGCQVSKKELYLREADKSVELFIWDIAGQTKFMNVRKLFYEGAHGFFLIYDITNEDTFIKTANWYKDIKQSKPFKNRSTGLLIGNKKDLEEQRKISYKDGETLAKEMQLEFQETSAKTGENIDEIFKIIAYKILNRVGG
ncbi:MAG: Rab family GTPase [Candidatus Helarchaeota archaeon]